MGLWEIIHMALTNDHVLPFKRNKNALSNKSLIEFVSNWLLAYHSHSKYHFIHELLELYIYFTSTLHRRFPSLIFFYTVFEIFTTCVP